MTVINSIIREIRPYMKENGFSLRKRCFFCIKNDLAHCVELEMPSSLIYVNCYIIPLYVPTEYRYYTYGIRLEEVLAISNINATLLQQWCNQLKKRLEKDVFPVFKKAQTPYIFLQLVNKGLFRGSQDIPKVNIYRLYLFTAVYEKDIVIVSKLCDEYEDVLANTTYLTSKAKQKLFEEIKTIRDSIFQTKQSNELLTMDIIRKTKHSCFGCD